MNTIFLLFVYLITYIIHISENEIKENVQYISYNLCSIANSCLQNCPIPETQYFEKTGEPL